MKARKLFVVVAYDISNTRKRTKVSKLLEEYGFRINRSVFECMFTKSEFIKIQDDLRTKLNAKTDSLVFYTICVDCFTKAHRFPERSDRTDQIVTV